MSKRNKSRHIRVDPNFEKRIRSIERKVALEEDFDVKLPELSRRISNARMLDELERELILDARAKRRNRVR